MLAAELRQHLEENFHLTEATLSNLTYNSAGRVALELEIWEANYLQGSDFEPMVAQLRFELDGVGAVAIDRLSGASNIESLIQGMRAYRQGVSDIGARTVFGSWFGDKTEPNHPAAPFEVLTIQTGDGILSVTFIEAQMALIPVEDSGADPRDSPGHQER